MRDSLIIGSRSSKLALIQTETVRAALAKAFPDLAISVKRISTKGDKIREVPLARIGSPGIFTREIEKALLEHRIDLAVHSLKDLPTSLPDGLALAAVSAREDPHDVLISRDGARLDELPPAAVVGTSSLRRRAQILACRRDLTIRDIRGNLDTRLRKLESGEYDAIVLALAGLIRLKAQTCAPHVLPFDIMLPAVGQGALAIETRSDDEFTRERAAVVNDETTAACVRAERAFLAGLQGGCQTPIGAIAEISASALVLRGMISARDGSKLVRGEDRGSPSDAEPIGIRLARQFLERGAGEILQEARSGR